MASLIQHTSEEIWEAIEQVQFETYYNKQLAILDSAGIKVHTEKTTDDNVIYYAITYNEGHTGPANVYPPGYKDPNDPAVIAAEWVKDLTIPEIYLKRGTEGQTAYLQWQQANPNPPGPQESSLVINMPGPWINSSDVTQGYLPPGSIPPMEPVLALEQYSLDLAKANEDNKLNSWWLTVNSPKMQRVSQEPTVQLEGATHYVNIPSDIDGILVYAIIRPGSKGYIKVGADQTNKIDNLDLFKATQSVVPMKGEFWLDQTLFTAGTKIPVPNGTQIKLISEGHGAGAIFNKVMYYKSNTGPAIQPAEGDPPLPGIWQSGTEFYIDSRVLAHFNSYYEEMRSLDQEVITNYLVEAGRFDGSELPKVEVPEPNKNFNAPDWTQRDECHPFLNEKTREYWITIVLHTPFYSISTLDEAKQKGISLLLEYYGKRFDPALIERLLYLGGTAYNPDFEIVGEPRNLDIKKAEHTGLFAYVKTVNATNRSDRLIKFLIAVPQTYFDHPSLVPDLTLALTRQQYIDAELVKYTFVIETDKIKDKISQLKKDLEIFKKRIKSYNGDKSNFPDISKKQDRLDTFVSSLTGFLKINGIEWEPTKNNVLEFGLDQNFKVFYITYSKEGEFEEEPVTESSTEYPAVPPDEPLPKKRISKYLRNTLNCINKTSDVFSDITTSAYLFYADQIRQAVEKELYPGIELAQTFTVPIPSLKPSEKSTDPKKDIQTEEQEEADASIKNPAKSKDQIVKENIAFGDPAQIEQKARAALDSFVSTGTDLFKNFEKIVKESDDIWSLFQNILDHLPFMDFITNAALCLVNKLGFEDLLENILNHLIKLIKFPELMTILLNDHILELMELACPNTRLKIEGIIFGAFDRAFGDLEDEASNALTSFFDEIKTAFVEGTSPDFKNIEFPTDLDSTITTIFEEIIADLKRLDLFICLLKSLCEAIKESTAVGVEELSDSQKEFLKIKQGMPFLEALDCDAIARLLAAGDFAKAFDPDEIFSKDPEQIGFEMAELEYSDDPFAELDEMVQQVIMKILNEVLVPLIISILEELLASCEGLNIGAALGIKPPEDEDITATPTADNFESLVPENLNDSYNGFTPSSNFPGDTNIFDMFGPFTNLDNAIDSVLNNDSGLPTTEGSINELKNLLNVLSNILKPTEICTLLSGTATELTLQIVLKLIQGRPEFDLLSHYFKSTDDVAKYFASLGEFTNKTYCQTAIRDISLISLLCEKELNEQFYCDALKQKGFSSEQCEKIINSNKNRDKEKLARLQDMLAAPNLSDYLQDQVPPIFCTPDEPGLLPVNDDYLNSLIDMTLDAVFSVIKGNNYSIWYHNSASARIGTRLYK